jgi:hypothetical protein
MKSQAWGWLTAGVLALGLNGFYQDGGAAWAHRAVDRVVGQVADKSEAVLALAAGRADWFAAKSDMLAERNETGSCRVAAMMARVQSHFARAQSSAARFEVMTARREAALARMEANRARLEARMAGLRFVPAALTPSVCPRVRISIPRVHVETMSLENE